MPITPRPIPWSRTAALAASLALGGCGGTDAPTSTSGVVPSGAPTPVVAESASVPGMGLPITRDLGTADSGAAIAPPELAATRDRAKLDDAASRAHHRVEQAADDATQRAGDFRSGVDGAGGAAQTHAKQAASDAADGLKGFADGLRTEASQAFTDTVNEVKGGITDSLNDARSSVQGQVQGAVDGARGKVRSSVEDAKAAARRKAKATSDEVRKSAQKATDDALNGLFNTGTKR